MECLPRARAELNVLVSCTAVVGAGPSTVRLEGTTPTTAHPRTGQHLQKLTSSGPPTAKNMFPSCCSTTGTGLDADLQHGRSFSRSASSPVPIVLQHEVKNFQLYTEVFCCTLGTLDHGVPRARAELKVLML